jgi:hypothetical protein
LDDPRADAPGHDAQEKRVPVFHKILYLGQGGTPHVVQVLDLPFRVEASGFLGEEVEVPEVQFREFGE